MTPRPVRVLAAASTAAAFFLSATLSWGSAADALPAADSAGAAELYELGNRLMHRRKYAEAEHAFLEAMRLAPRVPAIRHGLELVYVQIQNYELAVVHFEEALRLEPDQVKTVYSLAKAYVAIGDAERAKTLYLRAIELDPGIESVRQDLAGLYYEQGNWEAALAELRQAAAINPDSAHTLMLTGFAALRLDRIDIVLDAVTGLRRIGHQDQARQLERLVMASRSEAPARPNR